MESLPGQYWAIFDVFDGERIGLYNIYIINLWAGTRQKLKMNPQKVVENSHFQHEKRENLLPNLISP